MAALTTSVSSTDLERCLHGSAPARSNIDASFLRMRVARWSRWNSRSS